MSKANKTTATYDVEEYYFNEYYRVLVIKDEEGYVVSVDVYESKWSHSNYKSTCIDDTCLLAKEVEAGDLELNISGVRKLVIIGVKVGNKAEVISVKWILNHKPSYEELETIFKKSWQLVKQVS